MRDERKAITGRIARRRLQHLEQQASERRSPEATGRQPRVDKDRRPPFLRTMDSLFCLHSLWSQDLFSLESPKELPYLPLSLAKKAEDRRARKAAGAWTSDVKRRSEKEGGKEERMNPE